MKKIFSIMLIASLGLMLGFTSCDKDEDKSSDPLNTVNVSGKVQADLNLSNTSLEMVPAGTKIVFRIDASQLVLDVINGYNYRTLQFETEVKSDGTYSIDLPAVPFNAATVEIVPVDFKYNQVQADGSTFQEKYFTGAATTLAIQEGERYFLDLRYN